MTSRNEMDNFDEFVRDIDKLGSKFGVLDTSEARPIGVNVSDVRRRRGRLADDSDFRDIALVEREGVLLWLPSDELRAGGPARGGRRRRAYGMRRNAPMPGTVLKEVSVPILQPNEYIESLANTDRTLNAECHAGLRVVKAVPGGQRFEATKEGLKKLSGRSLVIVHGTFSSSRNSLNEYAATAEGRKFLHDALARYKGQVLVFDHPTLSVSPFINGLDLARSMAGTTGEIDVIAHSRGGVVTRWWLDVLGDGLPGAQVRAVLAGTPLRGTSLAAPDRLYPMLSVLANIGSFLTKTLGVTAAANPFALASFGLLKFLARRQADRFGIPPVDIGSRPGIDAGVAVIPGLQGQSAVSNNFELGRLQSSASRANVQYFAISADFEPERMGWKLWKVITEFGTRARDAATDRIFPAENDLVVDTAHMTQLDTTRKVVDSLPFGSQSLVHHCNYFRQPQTLSKMRTWLAIP
jgi:hypothetical protein